DCQSLAPCLTPTARQKDLAVAVGIASSQVCHGVKGNTGAISVDRCVKASSPGRGRDLGEGVCGGVKQEDLRVAIRVAPGQVPIRDKSDAGAIGIERSIPL